MNPRDPETAVKYIDEVKAKYDGLLDRMNKATSLVEISALEREGVRYVQELYLVTPRLQEALIITSQKNRHRLNNPEPMVEPETENVETPAPELTVEKPVEKPAKKKTTRKKTTKKATK